MAYEVEVRWVGWLRLFVPLRVLSGPGARVPGVVMRVAPAVVAVPLCVMSYQQPFLLGLGLALAFAAVLAPRRLLAWVLILFLAAGRLQSEPALAWRFFALLAGLHLLDVLARVALVAPLRGWVQLAVLGRPLRRFVVVQAVVQPVATVALWLLAPRPGGGRPVTSGAFGVIGAAALIAVTLVLVVPLVRDPSRLGLGPANRGRGR